ncbi:vacuolar protein 8 [Pyrus ussuriensis x Pyrus communis]|uniref:Vacuolar protein 8 n=1 Tax=Pyrus ussuriensis x Pyrus communis TaxID=2448454 RepID=A0A5N5GMP4_9ROSA|nr:vacuolar protein 8 [Pyrus ussuriensis x Pyrus communis]
MLSARLDIHARNLLEVYNTGVLTQRFAIVVSRPGNRACRDDMRLSAKIVSVISGFRSYKVVLIGAGIITLLIRVLECGSEVGKEKAAKCLKRLKSEIKNKIIIFIIL